MAEQFYEEMRVFLKEPRTKAEVDKQKRHLVKKHKLKKFPSNIELYLKLKDTIHNRNLLTKPVRTIAGVVPIAVMTSPHACPHGKCTFCPGGIGSPFGDVPQSYTGREPSTMRAMRNNYDPFLIVFNRLEQYILMGHSPQKVELIIMGGTFPARPNHLYQTPFVRDCLQAMNVFGETFYEKKNKQEVLNLNKFKAFFELPSDMNDKERAVRIRERILRLKTETTLEEEQKTNETAVIRCIGMTVETKPDWGLEKHGNRMLAQGVTKVEVGIQSVYQSVIAGVNRGHDVEDSIASIRILKDLGFKVMVHYMLGLPNSTEKMDLDGLNQLFTDPDYKPDMMKVYPTSVAKGTPLYEDWKNGTFEAITTDKAANILKKWLPNVPRYCRIMRILRDVPTHQWEAGVDRTNFRQYLEQKYNVTCSDIRSREPKDKPVNWDAVEITVQEYKASRGTEFFISADDTKEDIIVGFCRLRFPSQFLRPEITEKSALIRELHVYGTATNLGKEGSVQHRGWGKKLMQRAEEIAKANGKNKIVVISGIGVRKYYEKLGYHKEGPYMVKEI